MMHNMSRADSSAAESAAAESAAAESAAAGGANIYAVGGEGHIDRSRADALRNGFADAFEDALHMMQQLSPTLRSNLC
jgi:hypothetical protein